MGAISVERHRHKYTDVSEKQGERKAEREGERETGGQGLGDQQALPGSLEGLWCTGCHCTGAERLWGG